jgi:hypothetical protein
MPAVSWPALPAQARAPALPAQALPPQPDLSAATHILNPAR